MATNERTINPDRSGQVRHVDHVLDVHFVGGALKVVFEEQAVGSTRTCEDDTQDRIGSFGEVVVRHAVAEPAVDLLGLHLGNGDLGRRQEGRHAWRCNAGDPQPVTPVEGSDRSVRRRHALVSRREDAFAKQLIRRVAGAGREVVSTEDFSDRHDQLAPRLVFITTRRDSRASLVQAAPPGAFCNIARGRTPSA
ncbi:hypothetical protein D3C79_722650 [compost metagenome]